MRQFNPAGAMLLLAIVYATPTSAEVYRSVDAQGNVTFTNQPAQGAEPVKLRPLSVYDAPELKSTNGDNADDVSDAALYKSVAILSPQADDTLRDNPGNVTVAAGSEPALERRAGHKFQFFLDGKPDGKPQDAAMKTLTDVDRGEHQVAVAIVDVNGKQLLQSEPVRFFLHRQTIHNPALNPPRPTPLPTPR